MTRQVVFMLEEASMREFRNGLLPRVAPEMRYKIIAHEGKRDLENALIEHLRAFLLELGMGFAFVGSQYHLEVGGQDFYLDLLFYHFRLRCFIVIDLNIGEFKPEDAGKMNFYISATDNTLRQPEDGPSIGLILCRSKNRVIVEYALRDMSKPKAAKAAFGFSCFQVPLWIRRLR